MKISVQREDFDLNFECQEIRQNCPQIGALASFVGVVRADEPGYNSYILELEHYPGMTEKSILAIAEQARERFDLVDATVIHRYGPLPQGAQIVLVIAAAQHRKAAFDGCEFIMDYLKTQAPFWKKEHGEKSSGWVDAKIEDDQALERWGVESKNRIKI